MKKLFIMFIPLLLFSFISVTTTFAASVTLHASINHTTGKVDITGKISSGSGRQVTVLVISPGGAIDYIDQTTSGMDGSYQFVYNVLPDHKGIYQVAVSGTGVDEEAKTTFEYEGKDPVNNQAPEIKETIKHEGEPNQNNS